MRASSSTLLGSAGKALSRAALAAWASLLVYCGLSLVLGPAGIVAYRKLEAGKAEMQANLAELGEANARLRVELDSLRSDADRAAREARSLGYLKPNEGAILIAGRTQPRLDLDPGKAIPFSAPGSWPDSALKEIAFGAFLAVLAAGLAPRKRR